MPSRFPKPILDTLELANGDRITVRRTLTHGETTEMYRRLEVRDPLTGEARPDFARSMDERILAHLVDWDLRDDDDQPVTYRGLAIEERADVLRNMDPDSVIEISQAINANVAKHSQKKTKASEPLSLVTSGSPA